MDRPEDPQATREYESTEKMYGERCMTLIEHANVFVRNTLQPIVRNHFDSHYSPEMGDERDRCRILNDTDYDLFQFKFSQSLHDSISRHGLIYTLSETNVTGLRKDQLNRQWRFIKKEIEDIHMHTMLEKGLEERHIRRYFPKGARPEHYKIAEYSETEYQLQYGKLPVKTLTHGYLIDDRDWMVFHDSSAETDEELLRDEFSSEEVLALQSLETQFRSRLSDDEVEQLHRVLVETGLVKRKKPSAKKKSTLGSKHPI